MAKVEMAKTVKEYVLPIILAILTLANGWILFAAKNNSLKEEKQNERLDRLESQVCTKQETKDILKEIIDSRFDKFELFLQDKYNISPKR